MNRFESSAEIGNWLFSRVVKDDALTRSYKYRLLVSITILTGLLMWTYTLMAFFFVSGQTLSWIGLSCSLVHAMSPWVYKRTGSLVAAAYSMVSAGAIFQFSFSFFTGGFFAPTLLWLAVLPMIVGILTNRTHAAVWMYVTVAGYVLMFFLNQNNLIPINQLRYEGSVITQFLVGLGLIGLVGGFTLFFIELGYFYHNKIAAKNGHIRQLFRAITHDILNPLAALELSQNRMLRNSADNAAECEQSKRIISNIRQTVENARYFDAAESGRVSLKILPISFKRVLDSALFSLEARISEKNLRIDIAPELEPLMVLGDEVSLRVQIVSNALSNAIKFSHPGGSIELSTVSYGDECEVIIRDHGKGISRDRLQQWEAAGALSSTVGTLGEKGTGFGLLLMKHYLEKVHGSLQICSISDEIDPQNCGTRVSLFLKKVSDLG
ncbi:MAG: sensor histidine kinase [Bdellovibrio sp.]